MHTYICSNFFLNIIRIHDSCLVVQNNIILQISIFFLPWKKLNWTSKDSLARSLSIFLDARVISRDETSHKRLFRYDHPPHWFRNRRRRRSSVAPEAERRKVENKAWSVHHLIFLVGPQHCGAFCRRFVLIHPHFGFLFLRRVFSLHEGGTQFHLGRGKE